MGYRWVAVLVLSLALAACGRGDFAWQRQFGNGLRTSLDYGMAATPDGAILVPGQTRGVLSIGDLLLDARSDAGASTVDTPFIAAFDPNGKPLYATPLGHGGDFGTANGIVLAGKLLGGLERSGCRDYYLAATFDGHLLTRSGAQQSDGFVLLTGRY